MKILATILIFCLISLDAFGSQSTVGMNLGFEQGSAVVGADFDYRKKKSTAYHGFLLYGLGSESFEGLYKQELQKISLGGGVKIFFGPKRWELSLTPGLGVTMVSLKQSSIVGSAVLVETSDTLIGPMMRLESVYRFTKKFSVGINYTLQANWFSSDFAAEISTTTLAFRYKI